MRDQAYITELSVDESALLRRWLEKPDGTLVLPRITFTARGGRITICMRPWHPKPPEGYWLGIHEEILGLLNQRPASLRLMVQTFACPREDIEQALARLEEHGDIRPHPRYGWEIVTQEEGIQDS